LALIRKYIWNLFAFAAGLLIALAVLEIFIQKAEIVSPSFVDVDEKIGTVFRPGRKLVTFKEGFYMGGTNNYGYLGPAYPPQKERNELRIALIGDSYVEGFQLFDRYHFRAVMESEMNASGKNDVEVLNFGRSGFSLADMYCYCRNFVESFHPDIVLFFVHSTDLNTVNQSFGPRCVLKDGKLIMSYGFNKSKVFLFRGKTDIFRGKLSLLSLTSNCGKLYDEGLTWQILLDKLYINYLKSGPESDVLKIDTAGISPLDSAIMTELEKINLTGGGERMIVVNMGMSARAIDQIRGLGITVLDPIPALGKMELDGINPHFWKATGKIGHWNHQANAVVGRYLAHAIEKIISRGGM